MVIGSSPELQKPSCVSRTVGVSLDRKRGGALSNARQPIYVDKSATAMCQGAPLFGDPGHVRVSLHSCCGRIVHFEPFDLVPVVQTRTLTIMVVCLTCGLAAGQPHKAWGFPRYSEKLSESLL